MDLTGVCCAEGGGDDQEGDDQEGGAGHDGDRRARGPARLAVSAPLQSSGEGEGRGEEERGHADRSCSSSAVRVKDSSVSDW